MKTNLPNSFCWFTCAHPRFHLSSVRKYISSKAGYPRTESIFDLQLISHGLHIHTMKRYAVFNFGG